jgi:predicted TIM-barrel fold metal-dependent hydrolase
MEIVDCHVHVWATGRPSPAHRQVGALSAATLLTEMTDAGVSAAVIQPPAWDSTSNEVAIEAAREFPGRFAALGWFSLDRVEERARVLTWREQPGMRGFRFTFVQPSEQAWLTDGSLEWLWSAAESAGLPIALACSDFLPVVGDIATRHPRLRLLVDHLGAPLRTTGRDAYARLPAVLALARHPNVAVKASAAPGYSALSYPFVDIHDYLHAIFDAFGPDRMFWGTDITRMPCTWSECVRLFTDELPWLKGRDLEQVMGAALRAWIDWPRVAVAA